MPARESDAQPTGSAGLVNQGQPGRIDDAGAAYSAAAEATQAAALAKVSADWQALMSDRPAANSGTDEVAGSY